MRGLALSRTRAQSLIRGGRVQCDGTVLRKPGAMVDSSAPLHVTGTDHPWVSRGGVKLAAALDALDISPSGAICLDIGASTGGFTQVLRARDARRVIAVDVGHGQFAAELARDPGITLLEQTDARALTRRHVGSVVDLLVCDVSFISVRVALPPALDLVRTGGSAVILVKPQFELGPGRTGKGGVVRVPEWRQEACRLVAAWIDERPGWSSGRIIASVITGGDGNQEYFLEARRTT